MRRLVAVMAVSVMVAACGGGSGPKHIDITVNGKTVKTTPPAECARLKKATDAVDAYSKGVDAWNALSQAERDASHAPTDPPEVYQANWLRAHGFPSVAPPSVASFTVGC